MAKNNLEKDAPFAEQQLIAGWKLYVTNARLENLTLEQAVLFSYPLFQN